MFTEKVILQYMYIPRAEIKYLWPKFRFVFHGILSQCHIGSLLVLFVSHLITIQALIDRFLEFRCEHATIVRPSSLICL